MSDFVKGSISVRTRKNYAVVEASYEGKSYNREFRLPLTTNFDGVKTAMSNEGILTVIAPKKVAEASKPDEPSLRINIGDQDSTDKEPSTTTEGSQEPSSAVNGKEEIEPPLSPSIKDRSLSISKKGNFFQDEYFTNVWGDFEKAMDEMVQKSEKKRAESLEERRRERKELADRLKNEMFSDAERTQKDFFEKAYRRESLEGLGIPKFNRMNSYRNLRSWAPEDETQACTITRDEHGYKIVMDVKIYGTEEGDVSIKASEGHLEVIGRKGPLTFKREFSLVGLTNPDQVSASVSEDGILTVTAAV